MVTGSRQPSGTAALALFFCFVFCSFSSAFFSIASVVAVRKTRSRRLSRVPHFRIKKNYRVYHSDRHRCRRSSFFETWIKKNNKQPTRTTSMEEQKRNAGASESMRRQKKIIKRMGVGKKNNKAIFFVVSVCVCVCVCASKETMMKRRTEWRPKRK